MAQLSETSKFLGFTAAFIVAVAIIALMDKKHKDSQRNLEEQK
jgi:hypothetical protein